MMEREKRTDLPADATCVSKTYFITRVSQLKTLNIFYLVIYWSQKVHN